MYGFCSKCGCKIESRSRGIPTFDICEKGHTTLACDTLKNDPNAPLKNGPSAPFRMPLNGVALSAIINNSSIAASKIDDGRFVSPEPMPTPYERELLTILIEECAEVAQRATKMLRFGIKEVQDGQDLSNMDRLSDEIGDLKRLIEEGIDNNFVDPFRVEEARKAKKHKLAKYMQTRLEKKA